MALALVRWAGEDDDGWQSFDVELGSNRYYAWAIGSGTTKRDGFPMVSSRTRTSEVLGPLEPGRRGKTVLRVPGDAFDADHHHLQLLSFRDEELRGPAASDIISVPWRWTPPSRRNGTAMAASRAGSRNAVIAVEQRLSHAQFIDTLLGLVSKVLPVVADAMPTITRLVPSIIGPRDGTARTGQQPDLVQILTDLLAQLRQASAPTTAPAPVIAPEPTATAGQAQQQSAAAPRRYSYASWAQLLAALPALAPLLQQVLTPETVQTIVGAADPSKLMKTLFGGLMDAAKLGQEATNKLHEHLRLLNPGLGDDVLIPLLASMSMSSYEPRHKRSRRVSLGVADVAPVELGGYPQVAFRHGDEITLPVTVDTDRPIPRPTLRARISDAGTLVTVATREWRFERLDAGRTPEGAVIPSTVAARLTPGREYLVHIALTWQGRSGLIGATTCQRIRIVGQMTFDTMDTGGRPIRLDDVDVDRAWWHRIWSGDLNADARRIAADVTYEYRLSAADANVRRDSHVDLRDDGPRRRRGQISSGLDVSLAELSRLRRRLAGESLSNDELEALRDEGFASVFGRAARASVSVRGRRGSRAAVWVWPEVKLHDVTLQVPADVSSLTGQVLSFTPHVAAVPVPGISHVVTTRSG